MLIYVVDDDFEFGECLVMILRGAGHEVERFFNGVEAAFAVDERVPDVVVLDILLDGPSGFGFLHEMQSYPETAAVPVVVVSSLGEELALVDWAQYGVVGVLDKARMVPEDLVKMVGCGIVEG
jgi:DNA-binding response OmpR family regulator